MFSVTLLTIKDVKITLKDLKIFWLLIGYMSHVTFFILKKKFPKMLILPQPFFFFFFCPNSGK